MDLADIRFIVDENTLAVGRVMVDLRQDTACIGSPPVIDLLPRESPDREWIPVVARQGWIVVTNDHRLRTRYHEASLALQHGLRAVNMKSVGHQDAWSQLVRLTKHWQAVERHIAQHPTGPWWLSLTDGGHRSLSYQPGT